MRPGIILAAVLGLAAVVLLTLRRAGAASLVGTGGPGLGLVPIRNDQIARSALNGADRVVTSRPPSATTSAGSKTDAILDMANTVGCTLAAGSQGAPPAVGAPLCAAVSGVATATEKAIVGGVVSGSKFAYKNTIGRLF